MVIALAISELVDALLRPEAYPEGPSPVDLVETYTSWLFFAGEHVYKVKKPVDYGFLDFTTLEKRRYYCQREVAINRRLSPGVYLGVVEIRREDGSYNVGGPGQVVEYAVKMRRLPEHRAMDYLLKRDRVTAAEIRALAVKIAGFHGKAESSPDIACLGGLESVRKNVEENFAQTGKYIGSCLSQDAFDDLVAYSRAILHVKEGVFAKRAAEGRVRDCHGDLHAANVFLDDGIYIIDSIEFNDRFRYSDVAADVAFLAMDLDYYGRSNLSLTFVDAYVRASGDAGIVELLGFFKSYRAYVRGKVNAFTLDSPRLSSTERKEALRRAAAYFDLAHSYTRVMPTPSVVLVAGLTGTGKSTVAGEIARRWDLEIISSDVARKALAGVASGEHRYEPYGQGIYSPAFSRATYESILQEAKAVLEAGRSVVLDATYHRAEERSRAVDQARAWGAEAWIIECVASDSDIRRRLEQRLQGGTSVSDGRWEIYLKQKSQWEPVVEVPESRHLRLDTRGSTQHTMQNLLYLLYEATLRRP